MMSRLASVTAIFSRRLTPYPHHQVVRGSQAINWYSSSAPTLDENAVASTKKEERTQQLAAGKLRASYKRQVSRLRKTYIEEYLQNKARDDAARDAQAAEAKRRRLERQRSKNMRSVENAQRQEELRRQTHLAFQDHLQTQQEKREKHQALFKRARQKIIDELEEEAHLWLTKPEEVEAAFTHESEQLLWARPNGVLGVPNPSLDSHFWQYECHTWQMRKTYKTQREILLEELVQEAFDEANIDPNFWTPERVQEREALERKAKLRAMVRAEGRKALLKRQQEYLEDSSVTEKGEPPRPMSIPSLAVLADVKAQEKEGAELLLKDPTKFFIFDRSVEGTTSRQSGYAKMSADDDSTEYTGPSLGVPIELFDPLRTGSPQGRVFPQGIGKFPKPDMRSEREKKRQQREEKLWAAAEAQARTEQDEIDMAADEDMDLGDPIDYDNMENWDADDEEWLRGLDPERDADIISVPKELRYREEDIEWVMGELNGKVEKIRSHIRNTVNVMQQDLKAKKERRENQKALGASDVVDPAPGSATTDDEDVSILDEETVEKLIVGGVDVERVNAFVESLTEDQLIVLFGMGAETLESQGLVGATSDEISKYISGKIPDLSEEQIAQFVTLHTQLLQIDDASATN
jgi:hypothetical protein